jgi:hypothetical protein
LSQYYYSQTRNYLVASCAVLGVFLLSYYYPPRGGNRLDSYLSSAAGIASLGIAFIPTTNELSPNPPTSERVMAVVHSICGAALFTLMAVFALFIFTKTHAIAMPTCQKIRRNRVYRSCGVVLLVTLILMLLSEFRPSPDPWHTLMWLEWIALWTFGLAWAVKGGLVRRLNDAPSSVSNVTRDT